MKLCIHRDSIPISRGQEPYSVYTLTMTQRTSRNILSPIIFRGFNRVPRLLGFVFNHVLVHRHEVIIPFQRSFFLFSSLFSLYFTVPFNSHDNNDPSVYRQKALSKTPESHRCKTIKRRVGESKTSFCLSLLGVNGEET